MTGPALTEAMAMAEALRVLEPWRDSSGALTGTAPVVVLVRDLDCAVLFLAHPNIDQDVVDYVNAALAESADPVFAVVRDGQQLTVKTITEPIADTE